MGWSIFSNAANISGITSTALQLLSSVNDMSWWTLVGLFLLNNKYDMLIACCRKVSLLQDAVQTEFHAALPRYMTEKTSLKRDDSFSTHQRHDQAFQQIQGIIKFCFLIKYRNTRFCYWSVYYLGYARYSSIFKAINTYNVWTT